MNLAEEKKEPLRTKEMIVKRNMVIQWLNKTSIVKVSLFVIFLLIFVSNEEGMHNFTCTVVFIMDTNSN